MEWLSAQRIEVDWGIDRRTKKLPVGFIIGAGLAAEKVAALDQGRDGWSQEGLQSDLGFEWKELAVPDSDQVLGDLRLRHIAVRRPVSEEQSDHFVYAGFVTNRDRNAGAMTAWCVKGAADVTRAVDDLRALASTLNPNERLDKTADGRFLLAMLTYNLCSTVRRLCFDDGERHVSISRFREMLLHCTGRQAKSERTRKLKVSQLKARQIFTRVRKHFELRARGKTTTEYKGGVVTL